MELHRSETRSELQVVVVERKRNSSWTDRLTEKSGQKMLSLFLPPFFCQLAGAQSFNVRLFV